MLRYFFHWRTTTSTAAPFAKCPKAAPESGTYAATVVRVLDGDTLDFRAGGVLYRLRMAEIDAPEKDQPYGKQATAVLSSLTMFKSVKIHYDTCDRYGRIVGHVLIGNILANDAMVERGAAWFYSKYSNSAALYDLENKARDAKRGLWALPKRERLAPWEFRKRKDKATFTDYSAETIATCVEAIGKRDN